MSNFYSVFRASLMSDVSQNNQLKITLILRDIFWGVIFCYSSLQTQVCLIPQPTQFLCVLQTTMRQMCQSKGGGLKQESC